MTELGSPATDNYCIRPGFRPNPAGNLTLDTGDRHYWTPRRIRISAYYQHSVYEYSAALARKHGLRSVIDVGCGTGLKLMKLLAPVCARAVGVDQPNAVELCRRLHPQGEFHADNFESPTLALDGGFDLVICADVVEHVVAPDRLLRYLARVAAPGAWAVISTPERDALRGADCMQSPKAEHIREWNRSEFARYLVSRGLQLVEHRLCADMAFNGSKEFLVSFLATLRRGTPYSCQMAICRFSVGA